jgi:hypothetical protein
MEVFLQSRAGGQWPNRGVIEELGYWASRDHSGKIVR